MKITSYKENYIEFSNGGFIECYHYANCCEYNWADFDAAFNESDLNIEFDYFTVKPKECGILITLYHCPHKVLGTYNKKVWVPCYSEQNGYYSFDIDVEYSGAGENQKQCGHFVSECEQYGE